MLFAAMLILGGLIGFVGAGGAGVTIALLTAGFGVPIHTALAVALASMVFTMISGTISHLREGEVVVKTGAIFGAGGVIGALVGAEFAGTLSSGILHYLTGLMLFISSLLLFAKLYHNDIMERYFPARSEPLVGKKLYMYGIICGLINGFLSGAFGIGAASFIQITLMVVFGVPILQAIGTCMMIVLPISAAGSLAYFFNGYLDLSIFIQTFLGQTIGAFIGAKFTHIVPSNILKVAIVLLPMTGALTLLLE
ncbi:MAG: sulfite exporter TauE/SafE family protein [Schwartzia sp.]|nr:sulfite exporter TauE/SafE family protein [Schwartzia sp. (in: firmicutes)]